MKKLVVLVNIMNCGEKETIQFIWNDYEFDKYLLISTSKRTALRVYKDGDIIAEYNMDDVILYVYR